MIMETKEFQFKGLTLSGFAMLFLNILLTVLSAVMVVAGLFGASTSCWQDFLSAWVLLCWQSHSSFGEAS